jgi:coenzyme Q-binding protein COQ10
MPAHSAELDLPYSPQQVFDLVADIESYPKFLRHVASARIVRRQDNHLWVEQVVQFAMLRPRFRTEADLVPPSEIHVVCKDSPFGSFDERWSFSATSQGGTHLRCRTSFEFRSMVMRVALNAALGEILAATMQAFRLRARQLYGVGAPSGLTARRE